jgi:hypothetical protein
MGDCKILKKPEVQKKINENFLKFLPILKFQKKTNKQNLLQKDLENELIVQYTKTQISDFRDKIDSPIFDPQNMIQEDEAPK